MDNRTMILVFLTLMVLLVILLFSTKSNRETYITYPGYTVKYGKYQPQSPVEQVEVDVKIPSGSFEDVDTVCMHGTCTHTRNGERSKIHIIDENPFEI